MLIWGRGYAIRSFVKKNGQFLNILARNHLIVSKNKKVRTKLLLFVMCWALWPNCNTWRPIHFNFRSFAGSNFERFSYALQGIFCNKLNLFNILAIETWLQPAAGPCESIVENAMLYYRASEMDKLQINTLPCVIDQKPNACYYHIEHPNIFQKEYWQ